MALYRQLLRLVYRFPFLLVAEERGSMGENLFYLVYYGISGLRRLQTCYLWTASFFQPLSPFSWSESRCAVLRAGPDAFYARLCGLTCKQLRYILDPAELTERELEDILDPWEEVADPLDPQGYEERCCQSTFPGEAFRVLKEKELHQFGEYRTRRLVLEVWEGFGGAEYMGV